LQKKDTNQIRENQALPDKEKIETSINTQPSK
jgi:hypothetical protein